MHGSGSAQYRARAILAYPDCLFFLYWIIIKGKKAVWLLETMPGRAVMVWIIVIMCT